MAFGIHFRRFATRSIDIALTELFRNLRLAIFALFYARFLHGRSVVVGDVPSLPAVCFPPFGAQHVTGCDSGPLLAFPPGSYRKV